ncbi:MAG: hypothetical protein K6G29_11290 [Clostridiales bacterium]|nr:hypothetical protein [Clostridiales bacterium]
MEKKKKRLLVLSVCVVLLAAFLIVYHLPRTIRWMGTAQSHVNGIDAAAELEIDVRMWPKLFREPGITGAVTVDGMRYEDIHQYNYADNPFVPVSLKDNIAGKQSAVYDDYITLRRTGNVLTVYLRRGGFPGNLDRIFDIPVK